MSSFDPRIRPPIWGLRVYLGGRKWYQSQRGRWQTDRAIGMGRLCYSISSLIIHLTFCRKPAINPSHSWWRRISNLAGNRLNHSIRVLAYARVCSFVHFLSKRIGDPWKSSLKLISTSSAEPLTSVLSKDFHECLLSGDSRSLRVSMTIRLLADQRKWWQKVVRGEHCQKSAAEIRLLWIQLFVKEERRFPIGPTTAWTCGASWRTALGKIWARFRCLWVSRWLQSVYLGFRFLLNTFNTLHMVNYVHSISLFNFGLLTSPLRFFIARPKKIC